MATFFHNACKQFCDIHSASESLLQYIVKSANTSMIYRGGGGGEKGEKRGKGIFVTLTLTNLKCRINDLEKKKLYKARPCFLPELHS
jgi:hypothetical protein